MIRILICDDQSVVCEGLRLILETCPQFQVVGVAKNGVEALALAQNSALDVVLMDLKMPIMNGVEATRRFRREFPHIKVLVLSTYDAEEWVLDAIRAGAAGYLLKDTPRERLVTGIQDLVAGKAPVDSGVAGVLFAAASGTGRTQKSILLANLSEREKEILGLLAKGYSNAQIAHQIFLSEGTVRNYVSSILHKLGIEDRTQAAILAIQHGLG